MTTGGRATNNVIVEDAVRGQPASGHRVVALVVEPAAYRLVAAWAAAAGHELALVLTSPGPARSTYEGHREIVAMAPRGQDILLTTRLRRAAPLVAALAPDLLVSYTFPFRIPPEMLAIPRCGAVNLHPSPLPRYRGPNPARMLYDGESTIGATLHRTEAGFDTGPILSKHEHPTPLDASQENVLAVWSEVLVAALTEGTAAALRGEPGEPQEHERASYAAPFSEEEWWLDWRRPSGVLQRQATALNLVMPQALAQIEGQTVAVLEVKPLGAGCDVPPGTVLHRAGHAWVIGAGDGLVEAVVRPVEAS